MPLETAADWWMLVDVNWDDLTTIIAHQMDMFHAAYETPGDKDSKPTGRDIAGEIDRLKEQRDTRLARYFNAAWGLASESYAYSVPQWGTLCDLCSEEWVLYPPITGSDPDKDHNPTLIE